MLWEDVAQHIDHCINSGLLVRNTKNVEEGETNNEKMGTADMEKWQIGQEKHWTL
jgi:hypothetical protein